MSEAEIDGEPHTASMSSSSTAPGRVALCHQAQLTGEALRGPLDGSSAAYGHPIQHGLHARRIDRAQADPRAQEHELRLVYGQPVHVELKGQDASSQSAVPWVLA